MDNLIFSQPAVFRLQQLASQVYRHTGQRYKLSDNDSIVTLLNESVYSPKADVQSYYEAFVMELNKRQIEALLLRGVNVRPPQTSQQRAQ
jgi:hypothetical protein